jgi:hypothetical protein
MGLGADLTRTSLNINIKIKFDVVTAKDPMKKPANYLACHLMLSVTVTL